MVFQSSPSGKFVISPSNDNLGFAAGSAIRRGASVVITTTNGAEHLRSSSYTYRRADSMPALSAGTTTNGTLGADALQWFAFNAVSGADYNVTISNQAADVLLNIGSSGWNTNHAGWTCPANGQYWLALSATSPTPYNLNLENGYLARIEPAPSNVSLLVGQQQLFTAVGYDQHGNVYTFQPEWSADGGTMDTNGLYTATTAGVFTVTCTNSGGAVKGTATVTAKPIAITALTAQPSRSVTFPSYTTTVYTLQRRTNLVTGTWANVPGCGPLRGTGAPMVFIDTNAPPPPTLFYRLEYHVTPSIQYTYTATIAESRDAIQKALEETGGASMSVALVDGEKVIWSEAFGVADRSTGAAPTNDTLYGIGSVSKMLATIAVMKLVDQGKVKLDDPLVKYLPAFSMLSPEYRDITVRMLINHSSGFGGADYRNSSMSALFSGYAEQVQEALKGERLKHKPGYMNVYCNDGPTMVEILVKALTGQSYPEFVRQEILVPLGMNNSRFAQKTEDLLPGTYANSYVQGQLVTPEFMSVYASGGLSSTPSDMGRLAMMLMNGGALGATRILSPASLAEMGTDQTIGTFNPLPSDAFRYGLGWDSVTQPGMKAVGIKGWQKAGGTTAYTAEFIVLPEERLAVTVLTDSTGGAQSRSIAEQIVLRALMERGRLAAMPATLPQATLPEVTPAQTDEEAISGLYAANLGLYRASFAADHSLAIESASGGVWSPKFKNLKLRTDGWYTGDDNPTLSFSPVIGDGRRYLAVRPKYGYGHYSINVLYAEKLYAKPEATAAWKARTGKTFLRANVSMYDRAFINNGADLLFTLQTMPNLPGYLFTPDMDILDASVEDTLAWMFLLIPQIYGRDLSDIAVVARGSEEWLRIGSTRLRPLTGVPLLASGQSTVTIGSEGFNEWRKLPATGSVSIDGGSGWRLYDVDFKQTASGTGSGSAVLPGSGTAAYLMLFGANGTTINLNLVQ